MKEAKGVKNIIFDLGGVLLNINYRSTSEAFKNIGFKNFDDFYSQQRQNHFFDDLEVGKIGEQEFVDVLKPLCSRDVSVDEVISAWNAMLFDLPKNRLELLKSLGGNYRLFLLSNTNIIHQHAFEAIIESEYGANVLYPQFEKVYLSHQLGLRKPNKDCFEAVLDMNGLIPSETLFIDDSIQHIEGAREIGIRTTFLQTGQDVSTLFPDRFQ